jgi:hypothetical protein
MGYTDLTLKTLFSLAGNECAFPGCTAPVFDTTHGVLTGQICHIKGKSKNGPRYDPNQTEEERNGYPNLLVMCAAHNKIIDDEATRDQFSVELLTEFKKTHEGRSQNSVVKDDAVERIIASLKHIFPAPKQDSLTPIIDASLTRVAHDMGMDIYDFRIGLRNDGPKPVRDFRLEVEVPNSYANPTHNSVAEVREHNRGDVTLYRRVARELGRDFELYPGETRQTALSLDFQVTFDQYRAGVNGSIMVILYADDTEVSRVAHPIAGMLNQERVNHLSGGQ